jgi:orotate phosphoribosyltransferase
MDEIPKHLADLLPARMGHFLLESGHHGDLWLDLELLCLRPQAVQRLATELAARLSQFGAEVICGPLVEGAFLALMVAAELNLNFTYAERFSRPTKDGFFPVAYRIPQALQNSVRQKRVAIVNDVINAGSAVRGTFADLQEHGASIVAIGALLVLGTGAAEFAQQKKTVLETLATLPNNLWMPSECPLCSSGVVLEDVAGFAEYFRTDPA